MSDTSYGLEWQGVAHLIVNAGGRTGKPFEGMLVHPLLKGAGDLFIDESNSGLPTCYFREPREWNAKEPNAVFDSSSPPHFDREWRADFEAELGGRHRLKVGCVAEDCECIL